MENQKMNLNVDLQNAEDIICMYCEKTKKPDEPSQNIFIKVHIIKKISAMQSPSGKEMYVPVPIYICQICGMPVTPEQNS